MLAAVRSMCVWCVVLCAMSALNAACYLSDPAPPSSAPTHDLGGMPDLDAMEMAVQMSDLSGDMSEDLSPDMALDQEPDADVLDEGEMGAEADDGGELGGPVARCQAPCVQTVVGSGDVALASEPSFPADAMSVALYEPRGVVVRGDMLYVTDQRRHTLYRVDLSTGEMEPLIGGQDRAVAQDGSFAEASLRAPYALALDVGLMRGRRLYLTQQLGQDAVLPWRDYGVSIVDLDLGTIRSIGCGELTGDRYFTGLYVTSSAFYAVSTQESLVYRIDRRTEECERWVGPVGSGAQHELAGMSGVLAVAVSADDSVMYLAESQRGCVRELLFDSAGAYRDGSAAGTCGDLTSSTSVRPRGLAYLESAEELYFTSFTTTDGMQRAELWRARASGGGRPLVNVMSGEGAGFQDGPLSQAQYFLPEALFRSGEELYLVDTGRQVMEGGTLVRRDARIRRIILQTPMQTP